MQTSPHIKSYASLGTLRAAVCLLFCWLCLVLNAVAGPPPVITTQPRNQTVQIGGTATFEVAATSGTTLTYQWYFQSNPLLGATNSIYSIINAQLAQAGVYYVKVSNADGTVNSADAILTVNSAPSLSGANDLTAISQNDANNSGTLVSDLIAGKLTDPDPGALKGIAVVAANNAKGTWQYSINGGAAWSPFGSPTESAARLLAANANSRVRLVPNSNFVGTVTNGLTFRAWDQTIGSNGGTLAITVSSNTVLDQFSAVSYFNDDGTQLWSERWIETDTGGIGPSAGYFKISGGQDQLQLAANHTGDNIYREANLSGATFATLSYWYDATRFVQGVALQIEVSSNAGASYTTLKTYVVPGGTGTESFDITSFISANTRIRFNVSAGQSANNDFKADDVQITFLYPGGGPTAFSTNTASSGLTVVVAADIATTMTGPSSVSAGANYGYTVSVLNQGPSAANSLQVSQALPAGATFVSASNGGTYSAGVVSWSLASLASGGAVNLTVTVTASASGTLSSSVSSTAVTSDPNAANNDGSAAAAQVVTAVIPQADIATTIAGPGSVPAGANYAYAVSVLNQGPSAANSLQVSQALPAGATFVSASSGGTYNAGAGVVTWSLAGLASGVTANLTVIVAAPASGPLSSSVSSIGLTSDPNPTNNDGSAAAAQVVTTVTPQADIVTTLTGPSSVSAGANYGYAVSVLNQGPSAANSMQVSQTLPAGATFVSASSGGTYNAGVVTWSLAGLASGVTANLTVIVTAPGNGPLSSSVSSTGLTSDPNPTNNDGSAAAAQVVTTVIPQADIVTTMTGPSSVSAGANYGYAASVLNQGPSAANSVVVSQALPAGATFVSASSGGAYNAGVVTWSLAGLASGVTANLTVTVTAPGNGPLSSSVSSTGLTSDPNPTNNDGSAAAAQVVTTVTPQADIATTMTGPSMVSAGANYAYTVSVLNQGPSTANSVQVSQALPAGATFVSASSGGTYNAGVVTWSLAGLASGVTANLTVTVTAPGNGPLSSSVSSIGLTSDPNPTNNDGSAAAAQVVTTVTPQADIVTTLTGPSSVSAGANYGYAVSVLNQGPSAANSMQVSQTLPAGATFVSASSGGTYNAGVVTWSLAGLASGVTANLTVIVTAPGNGPLSSSVSSTALTSDPNAANNDGSAAAAQVVTTVIPQADIVTTMTGPSSVSAGANYGYAASVLNQGPSAANSVVVSQALPAGATFVSASSGGAYNAGVVTWSLAGLASGVTANLTVTVTAPGNGPLSSSVSSTGLTSDPNPTNNDGSAAAAQVVTTVTPQADIATTMTGPSMVSAGANYGYTVSVLNQGPSTANSVQVSQTLPAGATFVSASSGGTYNAGVVTWSLAGLASGVTANLTVTVTAPASGPLSSSVSSTALTSDPNAANNDGSAAAAQVVTTVIPQADIATTMTGPSMVSAGANYGYTVSVLNQGPSTANSVQVSQTLPAGATFVSASNGGTYSAGVVTWALAGVASGVEANLTVTVTAPASGSLSSSVSSTALTSDPNAANNDGSAAAAQVVTMVTSVTLLADIATTVTGPSIAITNANFSYTVTVANLGPSVATNLSVTNILPAGVVFVAASAGGTHKAGVVTWSVASLTSGMTTNFAVTAVAPVIGSLTNTVASSAANGDPDTSNNNGSAAAARAVTKVYPFLVLTGQSLSGGSFQVEFYTYPGTDISILASTNLVDWATLITTNSGNGHVVFIDQDADVYPKRFYRSLQDR